MLRMVAPVVCNVVREGGDVMPVIMPILQHLLTQTEHILAFNTHHTSAEVNASDISFPSMPSISVRGVYSKNRDTSAKQLCTKNAPKSLTRCTHLQLKTWRVLQKNFLIHKTQPHHNHFLSS